MQQFLEQVIAGIAAGGIYASLALALVLIYRAMGLINFAQGEFAMFTAFICWSLLEGAQIPYAVAVLIAVVLGAVAAFAIERVFVRPFERGAPLAIIIVTLALFNIANSVARVHLGLFAALVPKPVPGQAHRNRRHSHLDPGRGDHRRLPADARSAVPALQSHQTRPGHARGGALPRCERAARHPHGPDAGVWLGAGDRRRRDLGHPGGAAHLARAEHDAERDHLRVRGRGAGWHRQSASEPWSAA